MNILGINCGHDAGAALFRDGHLVAAVSEERLARSKHQAGFPARAIRQVLDLGGVAAAQVNAVAVSGLTAGEKLARLAQQFRDGSRVPNFVRNLLTGRGRVLSEVPERLPVRLAELGFSASLHRYDHHYGHALYSYYCAPEKDAVVATLDGQGHFLAGTVYVPDGNGLRKIAETCAHGGSLGHAYSAVTDALGFKVNDGEYKTMGFAAFGKPSPEAKRKLAAYFPQRRGLSFRSRRSWGIEVAEQAGQLAFSFREREAIKQFITEYGAEAVAFETQALLEETLLDWTRELIRVTGCRKLVTGGGLFLNVKANKRLLEETDLEYLFVPPGPGDSSLPAGFAACHAAACGELAAGGLPTPYLGAAYDDAAISAALQPSSGISWQHYPAEADFLASVAGLLESGRVVGWFQGRMEWGPRALGNRSVLAHPGRAEVKERLNNKLKQRDWFMPFAPSALSERCPEMFEGFYPSPYMNHSCLVREDWRPRLVGAMHVDNTARPHAVTAENNPRYYRLISRFCVQTGIPAVLNTSFNRHGEAIVESPQDALTHLLWGCVDHLAIGNFIVSRTADRSA